VRTERVNIEAMLKNILQEAEMLSAGKHSFTLQIDGPDMNGSADELRSAFNNLVSNAIRYTPAGGKIDLLWQHTAAGPQLQVRDTGIGFSPEHISRLTERFYRVDKSRSRETQGTGLGLAIVKHVLLRHGGTLGIDSQLGKGSTFTARLPTTVVVDEKIGN
ncbi:MAG: ATP-binding protein, partial [Glaciimonas sp.]|nr:ATP-binding protein [Glaciimonas sp.]